MSIRLRSLAREERGSAILAAIVLLAVMTILGIALFDLGVIENRLAAASTADATAFEVAQAGLERALERLQRTLNTEPAGTAKGWHNGDNGNPICSGGCDAAQFRQADDSYIANTSTGFAGGTYTIAFKLLTVSEAGDTPYGKTCLGDSGTNYCKDLILVRSSGTVSGQPAGYTITRTIQALVRGGSTSVFGSGITAGAPSGGAMRGNVKIASSINILGNPGTASIAWSGGAGQRNNWALLDSTSLDRLKPLPLVCPPGRACSDDSNKVESLGAKLLVARPVVTPAVTLGGTGDIGQSGDSASYGTPARKGKGPIDEVGVADGCVMPCTDNFSGVTVGSNLFVDGNSITKPYPGVPPTLRLLTDPAAIAETLYAHYACVQGSICDGPLPIPGEFFVNHAASISGIAAIANSLASSTSDLSDSTPAMGTVVSVSTGPARSVTANTIRLAAGTPGGSDFYNNVVITDGPGAGQVRSISSYNAGNNIATVFPNWDTPSPQANSTYSASNRVVFRFTNKAGETRWGELCWRRPTTLTGQPLPAYTLEFGVLSSGPDYLVPSTLVPGTICDTPATPSDPLLLYVPSGSPSSGGIRIDRVGGPSVYNYRGAAIMLTNGYVKIEESLQSCRDATVCPDKFFPDDYFLSILTPQRMDIGKTRANVDRVMGLFYTSGDFYSEKQTNIVGSLTANRFCFAGGDCPASSGGNVPSFFQASPDPTLMPEELFPGSGPRWSAQIVRRFWIECRRDATATSPSTVTGACAY